MNFDYWQGELSINEDKDDEESIIMFWKTQDGKLAFQLNEKFKITKEDADENIFSIEKVK